GVAVPPDCSAQGDRPLGGASASRWLQLPGDRRRHRAYREQRGRKNKQNQIGAGRKIHGGKRIVNFDELIEDCRRQDSSTFYGVVRKDRLLRVLREEQAKLEKESRRGLWCGYAFGVVPLLIASGLFLAMMTFQSN